MIRIINESCFDTMQKMEEKSVDVILTSPPYNMTKRKGGTSDKGRYDIYIDWLDEPEYLQFTTDLFNKFDKILKQNKVVIYNFSYSIENPALPYKVVTQIETTTDFKLVDTIVWKKKSGLPFPANKRRLSRIFEFIFIFVRKDEIETFDIYKKVTSVSKKTNQKYYEVFYNYIEARNNDGVCPYNNATYSTELCEKLLNIYATKNDCVYDPFIGSGTTAVCCKKMGLNCIGSELSANQVLFANERLEKTEI